MATSIRTTLKSVAATLRTRGGAADRALLASIESYLQTNKSAGAKVIKLGALQIDEGASEVRVRGRLVDLQPREFVVLRELARQPGVVFSREALLKLAWPKGFSGGVRCVDVHVTRLRQKIGAHRIQTVHRSGYKFVG